MQNQFGVLRCVMALCCAGLFSCEATIDSVSTASKVSNDQQVSTDVAEKVVASDFHAGKVIGGIRPVENLLITDQSVEVLFYVANKTDEPLEVLPWGTPLEQPLTADLFVVTVNGEALPYVGRVVKRAPPTEADYIALEPGEQRETVVNLSQAYDMRAPGEYNIEFTRMYLRDSKGEISSIVVDSAVTVTRQ